jgi:hypothetical protein
MMILMLKNCRRKKLAVPFFDKKELYICKNPLYCDFKIKGLDKLFCVQSHMFRKKHSETVCSACGQKIR